MRVGRARVRRSVYTGWRVEGWMGLGGKLTCSVLPQSRRHRARRLSWSDPTQYNGNEVTQATNVEIQKMTSHTQTT